jgi:hypothetical protein
MFGPETECSQKIKRGNKNKKKIFKVKLRKPSKKLKIKQMMKNHNLLP